MYEFIECHVAKDNIGEHDGDNRFLLESIEKRFESWQKDHEGCTPIGICYEDEHPRFKGFYPMVFEDKAGNRYWTHWDVATFKEAVEAGIIVLNQELENAAS